jgi:beta-lactam-binding protein with PASTA domain
MAMRNFFKFLGSRSFLVQLGLAALLTAVLVFLALQWLKQSTHHGEFVEVPDLSRMTVTQMRDVLDESDLRFEVVDSANYNPDYPRFSIIEQDPPAGNQVKQNRKIYVTVNPSGYKKVTVPDIIQVTRRNATAMLRAVGLEVDEVTYIDELGKDMVYRIRYQGKYVNPGDKLPKTSRIELVCGNGTVPEQARIKARSEE